MYPVHDICAPFSRVDAKERQFDNDELDYIVLLAEWVGTEIAREHQLQAMAEKLKKNQYGRYLQSLVDEAKMQRASRLRAVG